MKSIAIGINVFGNFKRQDLCIESLYRIRDRHPNVKLYNIQQYGLPETQQPYFETIYDRGRTAANTVPGGTQSLPMVRDFFTALAGVGCDYFIFLNSDIILTPKIVKLIEDFDFDSIAMSRLAINEIDSLDEKDITHSHFQIAGFDVWAVKTSWWNANSQHFPDYVYAVSAWDVDYGARMMVLGNCRFDTEFPPGCYHIIHEEKSHDDTPERRHNVDLFFVKNKILCDVWHNYLFSVIRKRQLLCPNYTKVAEGESSIIHANFKNESIFAECSNRV